MAVYVRTLRRYDPLMIICFVLIFIVIMWFGVVHGFTDKGHRGLPGDSGCSAYLAEKNSLTCIPETNSTAEMVFGDLFDCGYINTTTTLESLRDCFRD